MRTRRASTRDDARLDGVTNVGRCVPLRWRDQRRDEPLCATKKHLKRRFSTAMNNHRNVSFRYCTIVSKPLLVTSASANDAKNPGFRNLN
ncbi:unnamed protein product [Sphenostylis stenocarpa]|uniref:Uncharacterized protein n=1 Tax=Sphenostylis stenocarpa TaxID=92480 RepID=A0AA86VJU9_9FABA|nr:unnamed protein product [Sphenostylis stenocarpa]